MEGALYYLYMAHLQYKPASVFNFFAALVMVAFVSVSIGAVYHIFGMEMKDDGTMSGCLFDGKAEICNMTFFDHLSRWQRMFTAIPHNADMAGLLTIALVFTLTAFVLRQRWRFLFFGHSISYQKLYIKQNQHIVLFNYLNEAFSQGILNPKIY